jgi:hypothetical protein
VLAAPADNFHDFPSPDRTTRGRETGEFQSQALNGNRIVKLFWSQLLENKWPPIKKRAVSEAQSVLAACSDRTSKNGSNEHYTWFNH